MATQAPARPLSSSPAPRPVPGRWLALAVLCMTLLIVALDNTVLNVALPTLVRDLHASTTQLQWVVDAYVLVFAGLLLVSGSIADRVGRKKVFCAGLLTFAAGSAWAAFSGSTGMLIAARASMGIGGATMMPATLSLVTSIFTEPAERQRAIGLWAGTSGLGIALGPIVGGLLLARFWWGSVFLVNVPIALVGFGLAIWLVPDSRNRASRKPDLPGAVASITGLGLLLWSLIEAPVRGWSSVRVLAALAGGIAILAVFAWWERKTAHPMLPVSFFCRRAFSGAVTSVALTMFGLFGALFLLTQYLQFGLGYSALATGIRVLPAAGAIAVIAPMSSLLLRLTAPRYVTGAGLAAIACGLWQISGATVTSTYGSIVIGMILLGIGAGLAIPAATGSVMGSLPGGDAGVGSAANGAFLRTGGALGVAVMGSLLNTRYTSDISGVLAPYRVPPAIMRVIGSSLGGAEQVASQARGQLGAGLTRVAQGAFVSGMDLALAVAALVALCGCLVALIVLPARHPRT